MKNNIITAEYLSTDINITQEIKQENQLSLGTFPFIRLTSLCYVKVTGLRLSLQSLISNHTCINMKKLFISFKHLSRALLVLTSLLAITTFAFSQNFEINKLNLTDSTGSSIMLFLEDIPDEFLIKYGIKDKSEIRKATIGNPIAIYTIENNGLLFTNTWRIPLIIDNEYRALFTIFKNVNDEYKIVDFGAKLLAEEIHRFSKDSAFVAILRVYELKKDYYINETNDGEIRFQPIPNDGIRQYNFNDLIQMIK